MTAHEAAMGPLEPDLILLIGVKNLSRTSNPRGADFLEKKRVGNWPRVMKEAQGEN